LKVSAIAYRAHSPQWAFAPDSGEGARSQGGRFNPKGVPALYLSLSVRTCGLEMGHGFKELFSALTLVSYQVEVEDVVDLSSTTSRRKVQVKLRELGCAWRDDIGKGIEPASWIVSNRLRANGASGILVPSFANGSGSDDVNLVLWRWGQSPPHQVLPYDPEGRLPKNQRSWT
jgi:RES domain-containing protein